MSFCDLALAGLTGGGAGALDALTGYNDGDAAMVVLSTGVYWYHYDASNADSENSPYVIIPDDNVSGTGAWVLVMPQGPFSHVSASRSTIQSIADTTLTTVIFTTKDYDTLAEYNNTTGIFTATHSGYYDISANIMWDTVAWESPDSPFIEISKNSAATRYRGDRKLFGSSVTGQVSSSIARTVHLAATDTIEIRVRQDSGAAVNLEANAQVNWLTIDRIA